MKKILEKIKKIWSECPQNIPVNRSYFECPTRFVFDDNIFDRSNENEKNS